MIYKNITEIKANPKNPRIIKDDKFAKLVQSIKDFPEMLEKRPLVCFTDTDKKLVVLGGNMRLKAAKEVGLKELPILLADDWTEEQKAQFLIKDNVGFGEWDWDDLANNWDEEQLVEWGVDTWVNKSNDDLLELGDKTQEENTNAPKITDEGYSLFEIVMLHENKLYLFDVLNQVKREFLFDKTEDALMEIIRVYQNKN